MAFRVARAASAPPADFALPSFPPSAYLICLATLIPLPAIPGAVPDSADVSAVITLHQASLTLPFFYPHITFCHQRNRVSMTRRKRVRFALRASCHVDLPLPRRQAPDARRSSHAEALCAHTKAHALRLSCRVALTTISQH